MLNLDSFCPSTVERKLLIKELNQFCVLVENLKQEFEQTETRSDVLEVKTVFSMPEYKSFAYCVCLQILYGQQVIKIYRKLCKKSY